MFVIPSFILSSVWQMHVFAERFHIVDIFVRIIEIKTLFAEFKSMQRQFLCP